MPKSRIRKKADYTPPPSKQATAIKYPRASPSPTLAYHPLSAVASALNVRRLELRVPAALASIPLRC